MKIGILTVYFADYGSFLHATSLYKQLESMGYEVELIHESHRYFRSLKLFGSSIASQVFPVRINDLLRKKVTAYNTYCSLKEELDTVRIAPPALSRRNRYKKYDAVVIGSDELWSVTNKNIRYMPDYFGAGIPCPHFSYATSAISLNPSQIPERINKKIKEGLSSFYSLSSRDYTTVRWVEKLTGKHCEKVIDPTLLNPWFIEHADEGNYIAVYGEHFSNSQIDAIYGFARENDKELVSIAWKHPWCDRHFEGSKSSEVQKAFAGAWHCMSSTFHGTIFSVLAHRQFTSFLTELRGRKIVELLEDLNLKDRLFSNQTGINPSTIDYGAVEEKLSIYRISSLEYLRNSLEGRR